jgi:hypothetical protein
VSRPRVLLVIGAGRSGTSTLVGIVREFGFHVPQPELAANDTNPRGFGEPQWAVEFHMRLLKASRVTTVDSRPTAWDLTAATAADESVVAELRSWLQVQLVGVDRVVVKDPRLAWFLPLWQRCAADLGADTECVTMLRAPTEVLGSAKQWYGPGQVDASRAGGWVNIMLRTEAQTRGLPRAFVRYDDLLADWRRQMHRVADLLGEPVLHDSDGAKGAAVDAFIDPQLKRQMRGWDTLDVPVALRDVVDRAWDALDSLADDVDTSPSLDTIRADFDRLYAESEKIAQSSIRAAKPRRKNAPDSKSVAPKPAEPAPAKPKAPPPSLARRLRRRLRRALRISRPGA